MLFQRLRAGLHCPILSEKTHPFEHAAHRYSPWWASQHALTSQLPEQGVYSLNLTFDAIFIKLLRTRGAHPGLTSLPWSQFLFVVLLAAWTSQLSPPHRLNSCSGSFISNVKRMVLVHRVLEVLAESHLPRPLYADASA